MSRLAILPMLLVFLAGPAIAQPALRLSDQELAQQRGGIMTPLGLDIGFGATVRTYVDGQLALETRLTWTADGPVTQTTAGAASADAAGAWTATLPGIGGDTRILHDLADGHVANVVVNTASNRDIRQDTSVTLTLPQLPQLQRQFGAERIASSLQNALGLALQGASRPGH